MKLNNKGFAISMIIYSIGILTILTLLLIVSSQAGKRKSESELVSNIKDGLNALTTKEWTFSKGFYKLVIPSGTYTFQAWGASGGGDNIEGSISSKSGNGGYIEATYKFSSTTYLYIGVGGQGSCIARSTRVPTSEESFFLDSNSYYIKGGDNGGGEGCCGVAIDNALVSHQECGCGGGGATHVAYLTSYDENIDRTLDNAPITSLATNDNKKYILLAASGGGGAGRSNDASEAGTFGVGGHSSSELFDYTNPSPLGSPSDSISCQRDPAITNGRYGGAGGGAGFNAGAGSKRTNTGGTGGINYIKNSGTGIELKNVRALPNDETCSMDNQNACIPSPNDINFLKRVDINTIIGHDGLLIISKCSGDAACPKTYSET